MQNVYKEVMKRNINKQAEVLFDTLGLEPGFDIRETVGKLGGEIQTSENLDKNIEAKISAIDENTFRIECREYSEDDVYTRFSIAHELGHLFLHMATIDENNQYVLNGNFNREISNSSLIEWEAEEFAAAFLMPETAFRIMVDSIWINANIKDKISYLASEFKVPYKSIITRGKSLEIW